MYIIPQIHIFLYKLVPYCDIIIIEEERKGGILVRKKKNNNGSGKISKVKELWEKFRYQFRTNILFIRIFISLLTILLFVFAIGYGFHHKNAVQKERALTLSDTNQEIEFSKTGNEIKLEKQKRNKDMTVIPFKFHSSDEQSLDAKKYKVFLNNTANSSIPKDVSASLVFFGSDGKGAIVLKGNLKKEPMTLIIEDKENLKSDSSGSGKIVMDGKEVEVKFNAVAFNINPKGENVKKDKKISQDMKMEDLYYTAFGDNQTKKINHSIKQSSKHKNELEENKKEYQRRISQINKAVGKKQDDYSLDETVDDTDDNSSSTIDDSELDYDKKEMSTEDLKSVRNNLVNKIEDIDYDIQNEKESLKGLRKEKEQLKDFSSKMYDLTSISNNYQVIK